MKLSNWIRQNKLAFIILLVVLGYLFLSRVLNTFFGIDTVSLDIPNSSRQYGSTDSINLSPGSSIGSAGAPSAGISSKIGLPNIYPQEEYSPQPDVSNRLVIQESNASLLVKDVVDSRNKILAYTNASGGYMISSATESPEEAPYATISIRIPTDKLQAALDYFHSLSIKVVSENLVGRDVTDQYVDIDKRIATYEKTKVKYEQILDQATTISDITNLTREIINIQSQIDSLKGQQESLKQNASLARLTIYLSTDEIALPYAPSETFRPAVIFKLAVRSLVGFLRDLATYVIWIGVYAVIWIPILILIMVIRKWMKKRSPEIKSPN